MVEGVAHSVGHGLCPLFELLPVGGVLTGAETLVYTVGTHSPPLVVVAFEPHFGEVFEDVVVGHILGDEVAVLVDDGHLGCVFVIEPLGGFGLQQEVVVIESFHTRKSIL